MREYQQLAISTSDVTGVVFVTGGRGGGGGGKGETGQ